MSFSPESEAAVEWGALMDALKTGVDGVGEFVVGRFSGMEALGEEAEVNVAVGAEGVLGAVEPHRVLRLGRWQDNGAEFQGEVADVGFEGGDAPVDEGLIGGRLAVKDVGEPAAQGDDGHVDELKERRGVGGEQGRAVAGAEALVLLVGKKEGRSGGIVAAGDEDVGDAVAGVGEELHGGEQEGAHGLEAAGERGDHAGIGLAGMGPEFLGDGVGEGGVLLRRGEFVER